MAIEPRKSGRRSRWRWVLLALVALPFLPEAIILMIAAAARIGGCRIENACAAGPWAAETVRLATEVGVSIGVAFGIGLVIVWLAGCYVAITLGWDSLPRRLLLALAVTLVFAFLPYFSPGFVLDPFVNAKCTPNEGGAGGCEIYDGQKVGGVVHETATLPGFLLIAVPLTITAFALYVIVVIILRVRSRRRGAPAKAV